MAGDEEANADTDANTNADSDAAADATANTSSDDASAGMVDKTPCEIYYESVAFCGYEGVRWGIAGCTGGPAGCLLAFEAAFIGCMGPELTDKGVAQGVTELAEECGNTWEAPEPLETTPLDEDSSPSGTCEDTNNSCVLITERFNYDCALLFRCACRYESSWNGEPCRAFYEECVSNTEAICDDTGAPLE
jgi:hypothetical protein